MRSSERTLLRRWVAAFTVGELVGFGFLPALGGAVAFGLTRGVAAPVRAVLLYLVAVLGGLGEGAVLALFQRRVLRDVLPALDGRAWVRHTAWAAAVAWAAGMLVPTLDDLVGLSVPAQVTLWVLAGLVILPSIGWAQARVLRGVVHRPWRWLSANVLGWLAGLPWTFVVPMSLPDDAPTSVFALGFVVAGALMGATAGAVTGAWLLRLGRDRVPELR